MQENDQKPKGELPRPDASLQPVTELPPPALEEGLFHSRMFSISNLSLRHHSRMEYILSATERLSQALGIQVSASSYHAHTSMTSFLYPDAGQYRIVVVNIFYDLLYFIDDLFGEDIKGSSASSQPDLEQLMQIWLTGQASETYLANLTNRRIKAVCEAMSWVRTKLRESCEPALFKKLSQLLFEHLKEQLRPEGYRDTASYVALRRKFSGMYLAIHLTEYCYGCYLTPELIKRVPSLQKAIDMCNDIGGLSNDIFSYPKECHSKLNLVNSFLVLGHCSSLKDAVQASIDHVNHCHVQYDAAIEEVHQEVQALPASDRAIVLKFVDGLHAILSASYHWQLVTQRYRHEQHILEDMRLTNHDFSTTTVI